MTQLDESFIGIRPIRQTQRSPFSPLPLLARKLTAAADKPASLISDESEIQGGTRSFFPRSFPLSHDRLSSGTRRHVSRIHASIYKIRMSRQMI